ncbi:MAG: hypothetical protein IPP91_12565 [Betaproteobacteria bacterium]|nr:hypothetical protein [Betaproteobacteria bacterium]
MSVKVSARHRLTGIDNGVVIAPQCPLSRHRSEWFQAPKGPLGGIEYRAFPEAEIGKRATILRSLNDRIKEMIAESIYQRREGIVHRNPNQTTDIVRAVVFTNRPSHEPAINAK